MFIHSLDDQGTGRGWIRNHASEETGALNQLLRPLGQAATLANLIAPLSIMTFSLVAPQQ